LTRRHLHYTPADWYHDAHVSLKIPSPLLERIREHGKKAYPDECCGLLLGRADGQDRSVVELRPMDNAREDSRRNRYTISPGDILEAEREARRLGLDVVGVYHSHPDHPARPSEFDREHAFTSYSYVIVSVTGGKPSDPASWTLREDRSAFDPEQIL
jgi:proteasome lid subunit RPN8/RPN11